MNPTTTAPAFPHVHTDDAGQSHIHRCRMDDLTLGKVVDGIPPVWQQPAVHDVTSRAIWVLPPGWRGGWHTNPHVQWVIPLSGRWFVQTQDGARIEMGPGDIHLGDDLASRPDAHGRVGHDSGVLGDEPLTVMVVTLAHSPDPARCRVLETITAP
ncbi:hypothetical protein RKE30_32565 [Streptomyces sp. Li-HN-5-11]|uniref:hypothetical protein n=1 Tax=Streptomyces sp. Li-HN-5-11 TaxID=3075432 RepID=UPI0028AC0378|nr:hypothetical protein [Streptomyces sp. Li-HN-5-11]WNM34772.1 hypothetical protein RKE30_32565 [Streptomyces sp. Li-HN-5-11]